MPRSAFESGATECKALCETKSPEQCALANYDQSKAMCTLCHAPAGAIIDGTLQPTKEDSFLRVDRKTYNLVRNFHINAGPGPDETMCGNTARFIQNLVGKPIAEPSQKAQADLEFLLGGNHAQEASRPAPDVKAMMQAYFTWVFSDEVGADFLQIISMAPADHVFTLEVLRGEDLHDVPHSTLGERYYRVHQSFVGLYDEKWWWGLKGSALPQDILPEIERMGALKLFHETRNKYGGLRKVPEAEILDLFTGFVEAPQRPRHSSTPHDPRQDPRVQLDAELEDLICVSMGMGFAMLKDQDAELSGEALRMCETTKKAMIVFENVGSMADADEAEAFIRTISGVPLPEGGAGQTGMAVVPYSRA